MTYVSVTLLNELGVAPEIEEKPFDHSTLFIPAGKYMIEILNVGSILVQVDSVQHEPEGIPNLPDTNRLALGVLQPGESLKTEWTNTGEKKLELRAVQGELSPWGGQFMEHGLPAQSICFYKG